MKPFNRQNHDSRRQSGPATDPTSPELLTAVSSDGSQVDAQATNRSFVGPRAKPTSVDTPEAEVKGRLDVSMIGEHVGSVLRAAEAAADKLRVEAEQDSKHVREQAKRAADEVLARAAEETKTEREKAGDAVEEAGKVAETTRSEADRYAEERRRDADSQVRKLVHDAERHAAEIAETGAERHRILQADIAASEIRMRELAESLRDVASRLDRVVGQERGGNGAAPVLGESLPASLAQRIVQDQSAGSRSV